MNDTNNMTALVSCFAREYHNKNNDFISKSMSDGIKFFNPNFTGNSNEALEYDLTEKNSSQKIHNKISSLLLTLLKIGI